MITMEERREEEKEENVDEEKEEDVLQHQRSPKQEPGETDQLL